MALEVQQPGMARRMRNSTRWEGGAKRHIVWQVEWQFPGAAGTSVVDRRYTSESDGRLCSNSISKGHVSRCDMCQNVLPRVHPQCCRAGP